jgi:predicted DNA-binding protein
MNIFRKLPADIKNTVLSFDERFIIRRGRATISCKFTYANACKALEPKFENKLDFLSKHCSIYSKSETKYLWSIIEKMIEQIDKEIEHRTKSGEITQEQYQDHKNRVNSQEQTRHHSR